MSFDPDIHTVQTIILHALLMKPDAGFAELQKATGITSDHFTFHLKRLTETGFVEHRGSRYKLTIKGKEYANRMDTDKKVIERQPKSAVVLIIQNNEGKFIAQQRLKQPFYGFWGRPTGKIRWGEEILEAAARELLEETGLEANLAFKGIYHKLDHLDTTNELLEDKIFFMVYGTNPRGELLHEFDGGRNVWMTSDEVEATPHHFEGIRDTANWATSNTMTFVEKHFVYSKDQY